MSGGRHSLRTRMVCAVVGGVLATSLIFGLATFALAYSIEDRLFQNALADEVTHQKLAWAETGATTASKNPDISIFRQNQPLPADISGEFAENTRQTEFYGREGRHYHVQRFDLNDGMPAAVPAPAVAVIEVSQDLLVRPFRESMLELLAWISFAIAVVTGGLAWWLVNRAMKPLTSLVLDVARADSGIPSIKATNYPANEIGKVAEAMEQAFERIRGFVDREQAFTRDASHELRTPLAVVRGAAEVIALNRDLPSHLAEPLRRIETATEDMTLALDQLLALARENKGVVAEPVALRPMIDKAISWARVRYPDSRIAVSIRVDRQALVLVHPTSLQLVLNNLIGNCFQHVGYGLMVLDLDGRSLSIMDDGPGFGAGVDPFETFAKGHGSKGSGLGLDISRRLCEAAGIRLIPAEGMQGRGVRFRLEFPKC